MADSIRELTEKIYNEGVVKAQAEAELILAQAKNEAEDLVRAAREAGQNIREQARREAEEISRKAQSEMRLAAQKAMSNLKQTIAETLISKQLNSIVAKAFDDRKFVEELLLQVVRNWNRQPGEKAEPDVRVAPDVLAGMDEFFQSKLLAELNRGVEIRPDPAIRSGFKIGPVNGNYVISFTNEAFDSYFRSYLNPKTWELIFGAVQDE
jgi:V/A-type H+-transporting ATPase subunit E